MSPFRISAADHTGITVSNLERSLAFWQNVLGFELSHRTQTLKTGPNAGKRVVYVRDPNGTTIEFMQPP
jgi:catechol 2,3-dioxygenase-like lactoylglutathione lyase family enzyme